MPKKYQRFETAIIHEGYDEKEVLGSLVPPLFQSSTFVFDSAEQGEQRFSGETDGYTYSRLRNPTVAILEERIAAIENGEKGLAFGSGMAAISAVLFSLTKANDHIISSVALYGNTFGLLKLMEEKYNIAHETCSMKSTEEIRSLIRKETACIFVETPVNPTMQLIDLKMVADVAKEFDIPVVVDNTFCSPYLQRPLDLGCDIVVHSATKYIGGHGDVVAGLAAGKAELIERIRKTTFKDIGGIISPFDAWLLLRGLKTLPVRMDRHCKNAEQIFKRLKEHPKVANAYYPGDADAPDYEIFKKQMKRGGGMIAFEVVGTKKDAQKFLNAVKVIKLAVSLGDIDSLIQHPATMTHKIVPEKERLEMGITDTMIRLSIGLEAWEDLWEDLEQALEVI